MQAPLLQSSELARLNAAPAAASKMRTASSLLATSLVTRSGEFSPSKSPAEMTTEDGRRWSLGVLEGRFVELIASGDTVSLTATTALVHEAQTRGEPTAWVSVGGSSFYPPDLAAHGIDLDALPVVRVATVTDAARSADILMRSGAFAVVVLDLAARLAMSWLPTAQQTRLTGLAKKHRTVLLALTRGGERRPSALGSLVSLRGEGTRRRSGFDRFQWTLNVVKDKRRGPGWRHGGTCRGPDGLC